MVIRDADQNSWVLEKTLGRARSRAAHSRPAPTFVKCELPQRPRTTIAENFCAPAGRRRAPAGSQSASAIWVARPLVRYSLYLEALRRKGSAARNQHNDHCHGGSSRCCRKHSGTSSLAAPVELILLQTASSTTLLANSPNRAIPGLSPVRPAARRASGCGRSTLHRATVR